MSFNSLLSLGGPIVYILAILSIYALGVILYKFHKFYKVNYFKNSGIDSSIDLWASNERKEAYAQVNAMDHPESEVVSFVMYQLLKNKKLDPKDEHNLREEVVRLSDERINYFSLKLDSLEVVASIAPLLGLLGTVFGMIDAFQQMELAGKNVDPSVLSGGIWEALLTTAAGLSVAIPIVVAESYFRTLVERFKSNLENSITRVFTAHLN